VLVKIGIDISFQLATRASGFTLSRLLTIPSLRYNVSYHRELEQLIASTLKHVHNHITKRVTITSRSNFAQHCA
jgi:hypothetical protein